MPAQSGRIPTHEPQRRRRLSLPAARAAPPASSRPVPQPGRSPRSPSLGISLYPVLACTASFGSLVVAPDLVGVRPLDDRQRRKTEPRETASFASAIHVVTRTSPPAKA